MRLICRHLIGIDSEGMIVKKLGKKRLVECGKIMKKIAPYVYQCTSGHIRLYPVERWDYSHEFQITIDI